MPNNHQVLVARRDKKPLTPDALETIWMFCDGSGEIASEGASKKQLEARYKPQAFQKWCVQYRDSYADIGRLQNLKLPL